MAADDTAGILGEFAEFMRARQAAAAEDTDPDNERDIMFTASDGTSMTLPWRKAREFDIDGLLEGKFGLKRKAAPAAQGGDGDGGTGTGKTGTGKAPAAAGGGAPANPVASIFRGGKTKAS